MGKGVPESQMCYPPLDEITRSDPTLSEGPAFATFGYRLPTEAEWELAVRVGSGTAWFFGVSEAHLGCFAWYLPNSGERLSRVGLLRPNQVGLFDVLGNASEWCHSLTNTGLHAGKFVPRGGCYYYRWSDVLSSSAYHQSDNGYSINGFRLARTVSPAR